mgnify:CR=1 FL=1
MHGRELQGMIAASVYIACRQSGEPVPTNAVVDAIGSTKRRFQNSYRVLIDELESQVMPPEPSGYISYLGMELEVSEYVIERAGKLTKTAHVGGNPAAIAVAALYIASGESSEGMTLCEAGEAAGVAKETVWRHSQEMREVQTNDRN